MNCTRMEELIDDYVDGRLPEEERRDVDRHLAGCAACREAAGKLRMLLDRTAALPRRIEPPRDLLPGIREAIKEGADRHSSGSWMRWAGLAASLLIVVTALVVVMNTRDGGEELPGVAAVPASMQAVDNEAITELRAAEQEYVRAAALLADALDRQRGTLSPETAAVVDENLEIINRAIANVQLALNTEPGDPRNGQVLTALYHQKIEILRRVSRLSS
jgi:anti-sigma factor RsiW